MIKKKYKDNNLKKIFSKIKFKEDICIIHSDLLSFRKFNFSVEKFFKILISSIGVQKTFVFPAFSWTKKKNWYIDHEPSNVGALSEFVRSKKKNKRSLNPIHSVCILGPEKNIPIHYSKSSFGRGSTWEWLCKSKNVINISLGIGLNGGATFLHVAEETNKVNYRYYKKININIFDSKKKKVASNFYYFARKKNFFNSWEKCEYDLIKNGISKKIRNNLNIPIYLTNTFKASNFLNRKLKKNKNYFI